ncbi:MAG TPA: hypothetical protein VLK25_06800 [Allosphingosinicella sp.]|nr:hypothetical protein [Allosphingosinicella sp.]
MIPASFIRFGLAWPLLLAPAAALAQAAPADPAPRGGFEGLWTGWSNANRDSIRAEEQAARSAQQAGPAEPPRRYQAGSPALGERVGEVVRLGDCAEGERLAREAGDFPLVDAVRTHCRPRPPQAR